MYIEAKQEARNRARAEQAVLDGMRDMQRSKAAAAKDAPVDTPQAYGIDAALAVLAESGRTELAAQLEEACLPAGDSTRALEDFARFMQAWHDEVLRFRFSPMTRAQYEGLVSMIQANRNQLVTELVSTLLQQREASRNTVRRMLRAWHDRTLVREVDPAAAFARQQREEATVDVQATGKRTPSGGREMVMTFPTPQPDPADVRREYRIRQQQRQLAEAMGSPLPDDGETDE